MPRHTSSPERSGRLYFKDAYENNPAAGPLAMDALRLHTKRARQLRSSTDSVLRQIDLTLNGHTPRTLTPPNVPPPRTPEREEPDPEIAPKATNRVITGLGAAATVLAFETHPQEYPDQGQKAA